jgi:hypothetical protein
MNAARPNRVPGMPIGIQGLEQDIRALKEGSGNTFGATPGPMGGAR